MHHDAHVEALMYTRQHLGYSAPSAWPMRQPDAASAEPFTGKQIPVPGGVHMLGGSPDQAFVMDNEKWETPVDVADFVMDEVPVTQAQFADFVDDGGYEREEFWDSEGWEWLAGQDDSHPVYWRKSPGGWERRVFDTWRPLESGHPVIHVNWWEARAYCAWANRRLPTEAEWERAASYDPSGVKRYSRPWGSDEATQERAALDVTPLGTAPVDSCEAGASALGFRHLLGNVWEWTDSVFEPLPGFTRDSYLDNSAPWFGSRKVLRGGSWSTRSRYVRNTFRNYFTPDRVDIFAGFRTCATDS
ncbi:MAG: SUMF1/EgtB/PvdO family nonheme iron enzyme, partial [Acidimicrobiales bacterium]